MIDSRSRFEKWISSPPTEREIARFTKDETKSAWPGQYIDINVQLAWEAWEEGREFGIEEAVKQKTVHNQNEKHT